MYRTQNFQNQRNIITTSTKGKVRTDKINQTQIRK